MENEKTFSWVERVQVIALLLIVVGMAGEYFGDWFSRPIRKRLDAAREAEIARFRKEAEDALVAAAAANERAARLEAKAVQLQLELERERSGQNQARLVACLRSGPKGPIIIARKSSDEEADVYAGQIKQVLQEAQFEIRPLQGQIPLDFGPAGAFIVVKDSSSPPLHVLHVQGCFREFGVELKAVANPGMATDATGVVIAVSPEP